MQVDTGTVFAALSFLLAVGTFFIGRITAARSNGATDGEMKADVKYIKNGMDKQEAKLNGIIETYEDVKLEIEKLKGRLAKLEEIVKIYHRDGAL